MRFNKHSLDYEVNLEALHEIEELIPMTLHERECLRGWARSGHPVDSNPWNYCEGDGIQLNYLLAFRLRYGFPSRTWETWVGEHYVLDENNIPYLAEY